MISPAIVVTLALALLCATAVRGVAPVHISFERLTGADGISSEFVFQILQDRQGFLWFSTRSGLNRYDGYQSVRYPGFPMDTVPASPKPGLLYEDSKGTFWVATRVLSTFEPGRGAVTRFRPPPRGAATSLTDKITAIREGRNGILWLGSTVVPQIAEEGEPVLYAFDPKTGSSTAYHLNPEITGRRSGGIHAIETGKDGRLWIGTTYGLVRFDPETGEFVHYPHTHANPHQAPEAEFNALIWDRSGKLWVHMPAGLERFDPQTGAFDRFQEADFLDLHADAHGMLWLSGGWPGLRRYDPQSDTLLKLEHYAQSRTGALADDVVLTLGTDREGTVWGYFLHTAAMHRLTSSRSRFGTFLPQPDQPSALGGAPVSGFTEDRNGLTWISTIGSGLSRFDPKSGKFTRFRHVFGNPRSLASDDVTSMHRDRSGTLWVGSTKGLGRLDSKTGQYNHFRDGISDKEITSIFEDRGGRLWVGTLLGPMHLVDRESGAVTPTNVEGGYAIHETRDGSLWFGMTPHGLNKLDTRGRVRAIRLPRDESGPESLIAVAFYEDSGGFLWVATRYGLYHFDPVSEKSTRYTTRDGLATNEIRCVLPDDDGNLWLSTGAGISYFNLKEKRFHNYDQMDGLQGAYFSARACYRAPDGRLYFGGNAGFNAFYPREVLTRPPDASVTLTDFQINGKGVAVPPLNRETDPWRLSYEQNGLSFEFSALTYVNPRKTRYRFRMEGMEPDWTEADSGHRSVRYTGLAPGDYVFRVQASVDDGRTWGTKDAAIRLSIAPPWWRTPWSEGAAALAFAGLILGAHRLRVRALHERERRLQTVVQNRTAELVVARDEAQAANRAKGVFLANMNHELRTPLNAILGFSNLLRDEAVTPKQRRDLEIINRSGEHLLHLIDDVLEMAKIEAGKREVEIAPCDLETLVRDVIDMMRGRAAQKRLNLFLISQPEIPRFVRGDAPKLRQVLINLLGNAVRYTETGTVILRLSAASAGKSNRVLLTFSVEDTGPGIAAEDQERIFDAFVQVGSANQNGTGLGLTITRELVTLMQGAIRLESTPGKGSTFRVELPVELAQKPEVGAPDAAGGRVAGLAPGQVEFRTLVVDDEKENSELLKRLLMAAGFEVRVAGNGSEGVEIFREWRPQFVWMDLRMPVMDGFEAVRRIRELDGGLEVKIAALTASTSESDRNQVLAARFDDFVRKPYRPETIFTCMAKHLGVKYLRDQAGPDNPPELNAGAIAGLPEELRSDLARAITSLDRELIGETIRRVSECDAALGLVLAEHADRLAYSAIRRALVGRSLTSSI